MKCPVCDYARLGDELRCPNCRQPLTLWKNLAAHGRQAHQAGLHALTQGNVAAAAELLLRAVVFAPEEAGYLGAYGRVLGRLGRYAEAALVLKRSHDLAPSPTTEAAMKKAESLAGTAPGADSGE
jgi:hypothetical protein